MKDHDVVEDEVEDDDVEDGDVKGEKDDDVDVEEEEDDDVEEDEVEEEDRSGERDPLFVRACAVEMHFSISQGALYTEIYRKNAAPQSHGAHFARACAVKTNVNMSQEPLYRKNAAIEPRTQTHTSCEPVQSKCISTFHKTEP